MQALLLLLIAPLASGAWCECAHNNAGGFNSLLDLPQLARPTVRVGDTLVALNATVLDTAADPQSVVAFLAAEFTGGQPIVAAQLRSRCLRYDRGGFQVMIKTSIVMATRRGEYLHWSHIELNLFAACSQMSENLTFHTTRREMQVLQLNLRMLDHAVDPLGPLVDFSVTVCMPRVTAPANDTQRWVGNEYNTDDIAGGLSWWRSARTTGDVARRILICGPAADDEPAGLFYARASARPYVQVCSFEDAVLCAADAMLLNHAIEMEFLTHDHTLSDFARGLVPLEPGVNITRVIHGNRIFLTGETSHCYVYIVDMTVNGINRQIASLIFYRAYDVEGTPTAVELLHQIDLELEAAALPYSDEGTSSDCNYQLETTMGHACDRLVMGDSAVEFGVSTSAANPTIGLRNGVPCTPATTSTCPAIELPGAAFSGATVAGIIIGSLTWALIASIGVATVIEFTESRRKGRRRTKERQSPPVTRPKPPTIVSKVSSGQMQRPQAVRLPAQRSDRAVMNRFLSELGVEVLRK